MAVVIERCIALNAGINVMVIKTIEATPVWRFTKVHLLTFTWICGAFCFWRSSIIYCMTLDSVIWWCITFDIDWIAQQLRPQSVVLMNTWDWIKKLCCLRNRIMPSLHLNCQHSPINVATLCPSSFCLLKANKLFYKELLLYWLMFAVRYFIKAASLHDDNYDRFMGFSY